MRLMHFIHTPRHSGAEILVHNLCKLHKNWGHECAIASFAPAQAEFSTNEAELAEAGVELFFPKDTKKRLGRIRHYRDALCSFRPDVVFAHSELPSLYGRFATGHGRGRTKFITVMHSASNRDFSAGIFSTAERLTRSRVDHVVAVSELAAQNYTALFGTDVPVTIIQNGINIKRFSNVDRDAARRRIGLRNDERLALQVGRISDTKNQLFTLSALRPALEKGGLALWFAGLSEDPDYEARLLRAIDDWGLRKVVTVLGSRNDVPELLAAADIYLMPSKHEAHSVAMLEALASGVTIIASNIPAFAFARGAPGVIIQPLDSDLWERECLKHAISARHVRTTKNFSIETTAQKYLLISD